MSNNTESGRKILKDRKLPDTEQISKYRNFDEVLKGKALAQKILLKKFFVWSSVLAGTATLAIAVFLSIGQDPVGRDINPDQQVNTGQDLNPDQQDTITIAAAFIQPPLAGMDVPFAVFKIDPKKGGVIKYKNNTTIKIPANAFSFANGKMVTDSVEIRYREMHTPSEVFLSGIPMQYDSAGTQYTFETAGMIEFRAFAKGEELTLNKNTPVDVRMPSYTGDTVFNFYSLNEKKNWEYLGKPLYKRTKDKQAESAVKKQSDFTRNFETSFDLAKPELAAADKFNFKIKFDKKKFPELAVYNDLLFEVKDNSFKPSFYKIHWDDIGLDNGKEKGMYTVKLKKADTTIAVQAVPVFDKQHYDTEIKKFEEAHSQYAAEAKQKEEEEKKRLESVNKDLLAYNSNAMEIAKNSRLYPVYTEVRLGSTGTHNCDRIMAARPLSPPVVKIIKEKNTKYISYSRIYLVEKGTNAVFTFNKGEAVRYDPKAQNLMWVITDKNEFAFLYQSDLNKISAAAPNTIVPSFVRNPDEGLAVIKKFTGDIKKLKPHRHIVNIAYVCYVPMWFKKGL